MPRPKTTPETLDKMKDDILAAATQVFADAGFADSGMRQIAEAAGVFTPQLYQFFPDKRDLYDKCCERIFLRNAQRLNEACGPISDAAGKIRAFTHTLSEVMFEDQLLLRLFQRQLIEQDQHGMDALTGHHYKDEFAALTTWITAVSGPRGASLKAYAIYALTTSMIHHRPLAILSRQSIPELEDAKQIAEFVLKSLLPEAIEFSPKKRRPAKNSKLSERYQLKAS